MEELRVDPNQVDGAADAVQRNAGHLSAMTDYAEQLRETASGAFGSIFGTWKANHDDATGRQADLLRTMREKLAATGDSLTETAELYREVEERLVAIADALAGQVSGVTVPTVGGKIPARTGGN